jgi:hypothetical protein
MSEGSEPPSGADAAIGPASLRLGRWSLVALLVFGVAAASVYAKLWQGDPSEFVLATAIYDEKPIQGRQRAWRHSTFADTAFVAWLVSRHANTLLTRPGRLLDTEHCFPAERTIAFGEPMLSMGLLATPARLLGAGPLLAYNSAVLLVAVLGAFAMFLLVADWSGSPAAGLVAGLLYAYHPVHVGDVTHRFLYDMGWTAFAFFFAQRLVAYGRWRDATGLAVSVVLQMTASFYSIAAAFFLAPPVSLWLLLRRETRRLGPAQLAAVVGVVVTAAWVVYEPFLEAREATGLMQRSIQLFASWVSFLPGGKSFPGWIAIILVIAALSLGRERCLQRGLGDPRLAIGIGGLLVALAAADGNHNAVAMARLAGESPPLALPHLYRLASAVLPGFDAVRVPGNLTIGVHLALCLLAGLGAAALLRVAPERLRGAAAIVLVLAAGVDVLRPGWLGFAPRTRFEKIAIHPSDEDLAFFEALEAMGDRGPILEFPVVRRTGLEAVSPILISGWHGRRTSACIGSFQPPELAEVEALAARLPDRAAVEALGAMGFATLVVHEIGRAPLAPRFLQAAKRKQSGLRHLRSSSRMTAFALEP